MKLSHWLIFRALRTPPACFPGAADLQKGRVLKRQDTHEAFPFGEGGPQGRMRFVPRGLPARSSLKPFRVCIRHKARKILLYGPETGFSKPLFYKIGAKNGLKKPLGRQKPLCQAIRPGCSAGARESTPWRRRRFISSAVSLLGEASYRSSRERGWP